MLKKVIIIQEMKPKEFCFWLKGYLEDKECLSDEEAQEIKNHLSLAFQKINPMNPAYNKYTVEYKGSVSG